MQLPNLHFFVFYSGEEEYPSEKTEKLSGSYESTPGTSEPLFPFMELEVTVININKSASHAILQRCCAMREYSEKVESGKKVSAGVAAVYREGSFNRN